MMAAGVRHRHFGSVDGRFRSRLHPLWSRKHGFGKHLTGFGWASGDSEDVERLFAAQPATCRVRRGGVAADVAEVDLRVGDEIELATGARVPADGVVVAAEGARLDAALLTGEPLPHGAGAGARVRAGENLVAGTLTLRAERVGDDATLGRLIELASEADDALVRESAAAALGAIGDARGLPAILAATHDKPNVRRRAVLALAPFDGPEVDAAIAAALEDRDWQVRQAAEDLRRATGELDV